MSDVDLVRVRLQVLVLNRHSAHGRVVSSIPRARHGKDKATALFAVGSGLAVAVTSIAGVGDCRSNTDSISDVRVVVGHEVDLDVACGRRVVPVDSDLLSRCPVNGALVKVARGLVDNERRVGVLVLTHLKLGRNSSQHRSSKDSRAGQDFCEGSHT